MKISLVVLALLGLAAVAVAKRAMVQVHEDGSVTVSTEDGESETFEKSPPRKLGDREGREDGDTIRANCNGGKDIVGMRTRKGKDGKREMVEDGVLHMGDHIFDMKPAGEVHETSGGYTVEVDLEKMNVHGKGKEADADGKEAPEHIQEKIRRNKREAEAKRKTRGSRSKRALSNSDLTAELAIFVDQGFYDAYAAEFSDPEASIDSFISSMVDAMESDYMDLPYPVKLEVTKYEIWKSQPSFSSQGTQGGSVDQYLTDLAEKSELQPWRIGVDHTMVISGFNLLSRSTLGIAFTGVVCDSFSHAVSVMNSFSLATIGETAAHELAHSFGVHHDGDGEQFEYRCPNSDDLMAPSIREGDTTDKKWSSCSINRFAYEIERWDGSGDSCLTTKMADVMASYFPTSSGECVDQNSWCDQWYCDNYPDSTMVNYCVKTCNLCDYKADKYNNCGDFAHQCHYNPEILRDCPVTCA